MKKDGAENEGAAAVDTERERLLLVEPVLVGVEAFAALTVKLLETL